MSTKYNYPEHFNSFCSDFARVIAEDIPMKIYFDSFQEMYDAKVISADRKLDPILFIIVGINNYSGYFDETNLKYALFFVFELLERSPQNKTIGPELFTDILIKGSVIEQKHREMMIKCMESAYRASYRLIDKLNSIKKTF